MVVESPIPYTEAMPRRIQPPIVPGPAGPLKEAEPEVVRRAPPSLRSFLRSRFISANGVAAALYLLLSAWVLRNPRRAAWVWRRLQGR